MCPRGQGRAAVLCSYTGGRPCPQYEEPTAQHITRQVSFFLRVRDKHSIGTRSSEYDVEIPRVQGPDRSTFA